MILNGNSKKWTRFTTHTFTVTKEQFFFCWTPDHFYQDYSYPYHSYWSH